QFQSQPVILALDIVIEQKGNSAVDTHHNIGIAVIVQVPHREAAGADALLEDLAALFAHIQHFSVAFVVKQNHGLTVRYAAASQVNEVIGVAIGEDQVGPAVVVVIEEFQSPAAEHARHRPNPRLPGHIVKGLVAVIQVEREDLLVYIGNKEFLPSIVVEVRRVHAHPRARHAVHAVPHTRRQAHLLEALSFAVYK